MHNHFWITMKLLHFVIIIAGFNKLHKLASLPKWHSSTCITGSIIYGLTYTQYVA